MNEIPDIERCSLCGRLMLEHNSNLHHLVPKTFKGTITVRLHKICHNKIHSVFSERELARYYNTIDRILEHEEIQKFISWVKNKSPDFYVSHIDHNERKKKRK